MTELLFPGTPLILESAAAGTHRTTRYTVAAAIYGDAVVPLIPVRANRVVEHLVLPNHFRSATSIASERQIGGHRFDFLVETPGEKHLVEVKSCSLVEHRVAMFPDAPSTRATDHVHALADLARARSYRAQVIFVITHGSPQSLVPNIHTDPALSLALRQSSGDLDLRAVAIEANRDGWCRVVNPEVPVDLSPVELLDHDTGAYLLVIHVDRQLQLSYGTAHTAGLDSGYYVYVGSAMGGLAHRLARHRRRRKKKRWHIDYLLAAAPLIRDYPICSRARIESDLAKAIADCADGEVPGFGASDSSRSSHLFYFASDPGCHPGFVEVLFRFRHTAVF